jgi:hypothetical protein
MDVNFPVEDTGKKRFSARLFHFDRIISSEDALAEMKKESFTPATYVHGLAFGTAFPEEQRKYPIACLGSSARWQEGRVFVCLRVVSGSRDLRFKGCNNKAPWSDDWRFLGVQQLFEA